MNHRFGRRDFLKISAVAGAVVAGTGVAHHRWWRGQVATAHETRLLMGTVVNMSVVAPSKSEGQRAIAAAFGEMVRLIGIFDHRQPSASLAKLNKNGRLAAAPPELAEVLAAAVRYGDLTGGAFDVTIKPVLDAVAAGRSPAKVKALVDYHKIRLDGSRVALAEAGMAVTLDGIAKGYIVDKAVDVLEGLGFVNVMVEAGGDLRGLGSAVDRPWRVGVQDPRPSAADELLAAFELPSNAAATSGDYENAFTADRSVYHIIDPGSGTSPGELASATVLAGRAADADALSTSLMVLGAERGIGLVEQLAAVEALVVTKDRLVRRSSGFPLS
jgi:thiamine biosynthesis lipoprotein